MDRLAAYVLSLCFAVRGGGGLPAADRPGNAAATTFHEHVLPILARKCTGCHSGERPKGKLNMESLAQLLAGGARGSPIVAGKPEESLLFLLASGARRPTMPPQKEEPLTGPEIAAIRAWIAGGALPGAHRAEVPPYGRALQAPVYRRPFPVPALAYSADGARLFVSGYKEILVHAAGGGGGGSSPAARYLGEAERLNALALSPDGRRLAAAGGSPGRYGELQVWEVSEGRLESFARIGRDTLFSAAFSPDGARIVTAGSDRAIHVFEATAAREVLAPEVHSDWVFGVAFAAGGSRIVSGGRDRTLKVCDPVSGELLGAFADLRDPLLGVIARPRSSQVLAVGESKLPVLYDAAALKEVRQYEEQPGPVLASAFSADGAMFAVAGKGDGVRVYQTDGGIRKAAFEGAGDWTYALAFRPDGQQLAASGFEGVVRIFELAAGKQIRSFVPVPVEGKVGAAGGR